MKSDKEEEVILTYVHLALDFLVKSYALYSLWNWILAKHIDDIYPMSFGEAVYAYLLIWILLKLHIRRTN